MSDQLPANPMAKFADAADANRRPVSRVEGGYLSFNGKTGQWSMGQEETPVAGEEVLIASQTMQHGYIRWGEMPPAKAFTSVSQPLPEKPDPVEGKDYEGRDKTFHGEDARQVQGKFMEDDLGQFVFNTSSMGGTERLDELFDNIISQARDGSTYCYPRVELKSDFYKRSTGKVFKPVFEIVGWHDQNGTPEGAKLAGPDETPEEEPAPTTRRRRRKAA